MKIERQIGILAILLQREIVTAPELAEKFEVSRRTISRDIEELNEAGIPVMTVQGVNGGISIIKDYKIDRTLLTTDEMQEILSGLRSLDSVSGTHHYEQLMEKLQAGSSRLVHGDQSMLIDLAAWNKDTLAPKIDAIRKAIKCRNVISFDYYAAKGESHRTVDPEFLVFHWSNWYVWGYCHTRSDFRLFKLNRLDNIAILEQRFDKRDVPLPDFGLQDPFMESIHIKALFEQSCKWRLVEEYGSGCFKMMGNGKLLFDAEYKSKENLISWILSFGKDAELLEPESYRTKIEKLTGELNCKYSD